MWELTVIELHTLMSTLTLTVCSDGCTPGSHRDNLFLHMVYACCTTNCVDITHKSTYYLHVNLIIFVPHKEFRSLAFFIVKDCFHTTAKCVILILIWNAHFELKFERRYFGPCVRQITSWCVIWWSGPSFKLRISNYESRCDLAYTRSKLPSFKSSFENLCAFQITHRDVILAHTRSKLPSF